MSFFTESPVLNGNSVDPDQTPRFMASNLGLHCLPMSFLWDARHKWIKFIPKWAFFLKNRIFSQKGINCFKNSPISAPNANGDTYLYVRVISWHVKTEGSG